MGSSHFVAQAEAGKTCLQVCASLPVQEFSGKSFDSIWAVCQQRPLMHASVAARQSHSSSHGYYGLIFNENGMPTFQR